MPDLPEHPADLAGEALDQIEALIRLADEATGLNDRRRAFDWFGPLHLAALLRPAEERLRACVDRLADPARHGSPRDWPPQD